jgi:predicted DCC family thiol-disulfide oxidoreductase YuxK
MRFSRRGIAGQRDAGTKIVSVMTNTETRQPAKPGTPKSGVPKPVVPPITALLGVVLYDGRCGFCSRWVKHWAETLAHRGFQIASLDEPWVAERLKMPQEELFTDIRLLAAHGRLISGADVYLYVMRRIWWAWPIYAVFRLPGFNWLFRAGYRWFARNRYCVSRACKL